MPRRLTQKRRNFEFVFCNVVAIYFCVYTYSRSWDCTSGIQHYYFSPNQVSRARYARIFFKLGPSEGKYLSWSPFTVIFDSFPCIPRPMGLSSHFFFLSKYSIAPPPLLPSFPPSLPPLSPLPSSPSHSPLALPLPSILPSKHATIEAHQ